jgi:hypothetical protein
MNFFDNCVIPLAQNLKDCGVFGEGGGEYLSYATDNRHEWAAKGSETVESYVWSYHKREEMLRATAERQKQQQR